jgi:CrcB protein
VIGYSFLAIGAGAVVGAWLRWGLGLALNPIFPTVPLGTLAANLIGGFLIGAATQYFLHHASVPPEARLLLITGFLGALTTFSTFSIEAVTLLLRGQLAWGAALIVPHLAGSLVMTVIGIAAMRWLQG